MVQMKECVDSSSTLQVKKLYIPHGSDERVIGWGVIGHGRVSLYPTWFR